MTIEVGGVVIGAGAVGLSIGRRLAQAGIETIVIEREAAPGTQASSRNSEVIHSGLYYAPGSLKAQLCVRGRQQLYRHCVERGIAHRRCGKLIVATAPAERVALQHYRVNAALNGVTDLVELSSSEAREMEPELDCVAALWSPSTGIFDSHAYLRSLVADLEHAGGVLACRTEVRGVQLHAGRRHVVTARQAGTEVSIHATVVVNAAGLAAQGLAGQCTGLDAQHIPPLYCAKGNYFALRGRSPFQRLVYPVASDAGLGIHATLDLAGATRFGPDVEWVDEGADDAVDDGRRDDFARAIRRYWPGLDADRLQPAYAGIRPKIVGPGAPPADFVIDGPPKHGWPGLVQLFGIESPGLTASLAIADHVASLLGVVEEPTGAA